MYRHLFNDKTTLFSNDFSNCCKHFKEGWDQCYKDYNSADEHNYGVKLLYPVRCRLYLEWMKVGHYRKGDGTIASKPRSFVEKIRFKVNKINC